MTLRLPELKFGKEVGLVVEKKGKRVQITRKGEGSSANYFPDELVEIGGGDPKVGLGRVIEAMIRDGGGWGSPIPFIKEVSKVRRKIRSKKNK
jgi:hypothetical protein